MKPYPGRNLSEAQRIFNYRLSRARRVVENAFEILSARFRVFLSPIKLVANKTKRLTLACCVLHNYLIEKSPFYKEQLSQSILNASRNDETPDVTEQAEEMDSSIDPIDEEATAGIRSPIVLIDAKAIRDEFKHYFMSATGEVDWQHERI